GLRLPPGRWRGRIGVISAGHRPGAAVRRGGGRRGGEPGSRRRPTHPEPRRRREARPAPSGRPGRLPPPCSRAAGGGGLRRPSPVLGPLLDRGTRRDANRAETLRAPEPRTLRLSLRGGFRLHALGACGLAGGHGRGLPAGESGFAPPGLEPLLTALTAATQFPLTCSFPHRSLSFRSDSVLHPAAACAAVARPSVQPRAATVQHVSTRSPRTPQSRSCWLTETQTWFGTTSTRSPTRGRQSVQ